MSYDVKGLCQKRKIIEKKRKQISKNDNEKSRNNTKHEHLS